MTSFEFFNHVKGIFSDISEVSYRKMMGEYIIYFDGKVVGGLYDDRVLVKPTKSAVEYFENVLGAVPLELPYEGAKPMIRVNNFSDIEIMKKLLKSISEEVTKKIKR